MKSTTIHRLFPGGWFVAACLLALTAAVLFSGGPWGCGREGKEPAGVKKRVGEARQAPDTAAPKTATQAVQAPQEAVPEAEGEAESGAGQEEAQPEERARLKRDPFKSFVETRAPALAEKSSKALTPLQRYKLEQLKVVGIVMGAETNKALLEDDVGKGYVVTVGDLVGDQEGKITAIEKDRLVIEESYRDVMGEPKVRRIVKRLYAAEEGENP